MKRRPYVRLKSVAPTGGGGRESVPSPEELISLKQSYDMHLSEMDQMLGEYKDLLTDLVSIRCELKKRFIDEVCPDESN